MNPFHAKDHHKLIAEPTTFRTRGDEGSWARTVARNALALEITGQLAQRGSTFHFRGGTPLQAMLEWPPRRASIDNDYVATDAERLYQDLSTVVDQFAHSRWILRKLPSGGFPGFRADVVMPTTPRPIAVRIEALQTESLPSSAAPWSMPGPWSRVKLDSVATLEAQAAAKLLLTADPPFGRTVADPANDRGRKSRIKDLYDLACLGSRPLRDTDIRVATLEEVRRKSSSIGHAFDAPKVIGEALRGARVFALPRGRDAASAPLWRAFTQVRRTIRDPFTELDARMAAGCTHHALLLLETGDVDWKDSWAPFNDRQAKRRATGARRWAPGFSFRGADEGIAGLAEAWSLPP